MPKSDFIPSADTQFLTWHDKWKAAIAALAGTFGLIAAEVNAVATENAEVHTAVAAADAATAAAQQATKNKAASRSKVEKNARNLARRIKAHKNYTPALGEQLGIEGAESSPNVATAKPTLKAVGKLHGEVQLQFSKEQSDGVNLYSQRDGEAAMTFLARDTYSPYVDNRPLLVAGKSETRRYQAVYLRNDAETGEPSDVVIVTCQP